MKLQHFEQREGYRFVLAFETGESREVDLEDLLGAYVSLADLATARIDPDWKCLEFRDGQVDIDPATLYRYALELGEQRAA